MAKEFFKNTADAFKVLFQETREAGKRFAQSEPAQKVAAEVKETIQELESSPIGTRIQGAVEKVGDEISHQVKKLYKVCPTCGRKWHPATITAPAAAIRFSRSLLSGTKPKPQNLQPRKNPFRKAISQIHRQRRKNRKL